jgi:Uncharacterized protein conserved in bacteria (DUF2066)
MLRRLLPVAGIAAIFLLSMAPLPGRAADDDGFTVAGVHVDVTANDAITARDQALAQGQQQAFDILMSRIASGRAPHVGADQLTDLVSGFEVANERRSGVRYVADYTFHFKPNAVRKLLEGASVPVVETPSRPVLVLPVLKRGDRAVLWDDPNPWRAAWTGSDGGAMPIIVPLGDLDDVNAIDARAALRGDPAAIKAISDRYRNADVVVAQATPRSAPDRIDISATRYGAGESGTPQTMVVSTAAKPGEGESDLMARAAGDVIAQLKSTWKSANALDPNRGGTLTAHVMARGLADWVAVRDRLRAVPAIKSSELVSFSRDQLQVAIRYIGDVSQLRDALRQRDLDLTGSDPDWTLERHAAAPAPPGPSGAATPGADKLRKADGGQ